MDKFVTDQAEGLRRLLGRGGPHVIAVAGGSDGLGRTTTVINLAAALTGQGKNVVVVDEWCGVLSVSEVMGGSDSLASVARGELPVAEAVARHAPGFGVLAAPLAGQRWLAGAPLTRLLSGHADIVLVDAQLDVDGALSPLATQAHDLMVVMRVEPQAITDAYACVKRLHFAHAVGQLRVLINCVESQAEAKTVFDNLAGVASRYLNVALEHAGCITADPYMPRAQGLARCIVDAFPSTAAARDYRQLAAALQYWPIRPALSARGGPGGAPEPASGYAGRQQQGDVPVQRTSAQHA
ncbi:flagellar biosynthesis protein FlhG [Burkholderia sp. WAC0059]|uniref:MinD/ParA family ATP-binding protein n=1 Tax=Burkholderia sp. WAC0059 TaxID=2066022 RepID=UPI000C7ECCF2|nr:flagellar biosynthesis protein FlhG [Burkholderia sp. WAC0059]PLZ00654.1 flagellar biosynthesis protein FlhG [Burkholderia sp. WAC0059]